MKFLLIILLFALNVLSLETYPYQTFERESLGTILYSIGAKRLWGEQGTVVKHQRINKISPQHEFSNNEILRIVKDDIRFKCNVEIREGKLFIKEALKTKKDRIRLLANNPNCFDQKIAIVHPIKPMPISNPRKYIRKKLARIKRNTFTLDSKIKTKSIQPESVALNVKKMRTHKSNYKEKYRVSYFNSRRSFNLRRDGQSQSTVQNSSLGLRFESLRAAESKGLMGNFALSVSAVNQDNPNISYDTIGDLSYELGYKFHDKLMMSLMLNTSKSQYLDFDQTLSDLYLIDGLINIHYYTSFLKRKNKITFFAGGSQGGNEFRGVSSGINSEVIIENLSFGIYYQYRNLFNETQDLNQNIFGLSLGHIF
jgi:hypothetical protein